MDTDYRTINTRIGQVHIRPDEIEIEESGFRAKFLRFMYGEERFFAVFGTSLSALLLIWLIQSGEFFTVAGQGLFSDWASFNILDHAESFGATFSFLSFSGMLMKSLRKFTTQSLIPRSAISSIFLSRGIAWISPDTLEISFTDENGREKKRGLVFHTNSTERAIYALVTGTALNDLGYPYESKTLKTSTKNVKN